MQGFVIAGTNSGCGKTTVTLGILSYLIRQKKLNVVSFKVGPDFIDPGHHRSITHKKTYNLDGWMLSKTTNQQIFMHGCANADIAVVEGVMGLYDGYDGKTDAGSTAEIAKWLSLPVILVVNAQSMARSAAALVQGFENFDPDIRFAGVIFNNIGSPRHLIYLQQAMKHHVSIPCLGGLPRTLNIELPHRHLGLITTEDHPLSQNYIDRLASLIDEHIDMDELLRSEQFPVKVYSTHKNDSIPDHQVRIAVARDQAFCFYYEDNLDLLRKAGAELVFFSPLHDKVLPENIHGIYLGGGYPELHAKILSENSNIRKAIQHHSKTNLPIYAECGGFMYLCKELHDINGNIWPMCNCFPWGTRMLDKLASLGYRHVTLIQDTVWGKIGDTARGHEFHYSTIEREVHSVSTTYQVQKRTQQEFQPEGFYINQTLGSYIHLHFASLPMMASHFVATCLNYKRILCNDESTRN
ncbi:MAG: cobyrinate a,c-diamide synthase [Desulfobacterales bacterium]|nr:cobyrinate a,c-diamide synthase [Desulfobacterales bacterium]